MKNVGKAVVGILALLSSVSWVTAMTDTSTGISFADRLNGLELFGVGVRKKGPIKVYSVGVYSSSSLRDTLSSLSRSAEKGKQALAALRSGAQDTHTAFLLKMNFKVGAEKMASAIVESVAPRAGGTSPDVDLLKDLILQGILAKGGAATKGTTLQFDCTPSSGIQVAVDNQKQGSVSSPLLAKAFCGVFLDDDGVSPALRTSCLENCCAE